MSDLLLWPIILKIFFNKAKNERDNSKTLNHFFQESGPEIENHESHTFPTKSSGHRLQVGLLRVLRRTEAILLEDVPLITYCSGLG